MLGTYVNTIVIIIGSLIGLLIKHGLKEKYKSIVMQGIGLSVLFIGGASALGNLFADGAEPILFIISLVLGGLAGEKLGIEDALERLGETIQQKVGSKDSNIAAGFVSASLIFCVGTMAILGSLNSGLKGEHDMLYAKSVLDGVTAIVLTSSIGIGVIFSAGAVLVYQGTIVMLARFIEPFMTPDLMREVSIIGGILIFSIGLNLLEIKKIRTANLLPAILVPAGYYFLWVPVMEKILG